jgi:hypothetical protein
MKYVRNLAVLAVAVGALTLPATVSAHPSVYTGEGRIVTSLTGVTPVTVGPQVRYTVTNHGYTTVLRETNGEDTHGVLSYAMVPGAYRGQAGFEPGPPGTRTRLLDEADTGAQAHATCKGVPALAAETAILGWQDADPFYNYVPFQATGAGLDDNPAAWLDDVEALTGLDLTQVADLAAACSGLGGTFVPADETQSTIASLASGSLHPLEEEIALLSEDLDAADAQTAELEQQNQALQAEVARLKAEAIRLQIDKATASSTIQAAMAGASLKLTGPAGKSALVRLLLSNQYQAKRLGLKSRVLGSGTVRFAADGTGTIKITPTGKPADALKKAKSEVKVLFQAVSGDRVVAIRSTLEK